MTPLDAFGQHIHDLLADRKATMAVFTSDYRPLNMYAIYQKAP